MLKPGESQTLRGIITIIGGLILHFVIGQTYQWGTIMQYIVSYFKTQENPDLKLDNCTFVFQIFFTLFSLFIPVGSFLIRLVPYPFFYASTFGILQGIFILISSYVKNFWAFIVTYSIVPGILNGTQYVLPMFLSMQYFPKRKALVSGLILAGLGLGTLCFNLLFQKILNPDNLSPIKEPGSSSKSKYFMGKSVSVANKVPDCIRIMALIWTILPIIGGILMNFPKQQQKTKGQKKGENDIVDIEDIGMFLDMDPYFMMQLQDIGLELEGVEETIQPRQIKQKKHNNIIGSNDPSHKTHSNAGNYINEMQIVSMKGQENEHIDGKQDAMEQNVTPQKRQGLQENKDIQQTGQCSGDIEITVPKSELDMIAKVSQLQSSCKKNENNGIIASPNEQKEEASLLFNAPENKQNEEIKFNQPQITKKDIKKQRKSILFRLDTNKNDKDIAKILNPNEVEINVKENNTNSNQHNKQLVVEGKEGKLIIDKSKLDENILNMQIEKDGQKINIVRKINKSLAVENQPEKRKTLIEEQMQQLQEQQKKQLEIKQMKENCPSLLVALKSNLSIYYMILQTCLIMFGLFMVNAYKNYGSEYISDDKLLTLAGSLGAIFNALGRIANTQILDMFGFKKLFIVLNVFMCFQSALFPTAVHHEGWYVFWIFFTYFTYGGVQGITPGVCARFFGTLVGAQALGFFLIAQSIGNWIEYIFILTMKEKYGYKTIFWINFGIVTVTLVGSILFKPYVDWTKENKLYKEQEPNRKQKAIKISRRKANSYLLQQIQELKDENYDLSLQLQEIKAFLKLN